METKQRWLPKETRRRTRNEKQPELNLTANEIDVVGFN